MVKSLSEVEVTAAHIQQVFSGIANQIKSLDEVVAEIAAASRSRAGLGEVNTAVSRWTKSPVHPPQRKKTRRPRKK